MDILAEQLAKLFWTTYDPIVRAVGTIESDEMPWEELLPGTREALIKTFKNLLILGLIGAGPRLPTS